MLAYMVSIACGLVVLGGSYGLFLTFSEVDAKRDRDWFIGAVSGIGACVVIFLILLLEKIFHNTH